MALAAATSLIEMAEDVKGRAGRPQRGANWRDLARGLRTAAVAENPAQGDNAASRNAATGATFAQSAAAISPAILAHRRRPPIIRGGMVGFRV